MPQELKKPQVYIASSWKNEHGVEQLTDALESQGWEVLSFIRNANEEMDTKLSFDEWCWSEDGERSFQYDSKSAMTADLFIYYGPSGIDAWCELGMAYANQRIIYGLCANKGEEVGLMRRAIRKFFTSYVDLLYQTHRLYNQLAKGDLPDEFFEF